MEIIVSILLVLFAIVAIIILIVVNQKRRKENTEEEIPSAPASDCCGAHEVCEVDQVKLDESIIEYFDDEELDAYKNIEADTYSDSQIDEFREILYTLNPDDILHWLLSLERRKINIPAILLAEVRMIMVDSLIDTNPVK
jgi:hypothetical protein